MQETMWNYQLNQQHQETLLRQAEQSRHARELQASRTKAGRYSLAMARVGKALTHLGDSLQERYGAS